MFENRPSGSSKHSSLDIYNTTHATSATHSRLLLQLGQLLLHHAIIKEKYSMELSARKSSILTIMTYDD